MTARRQTEAEVIAKELAAADRLFEKHRIVAHIGGFGQPTTVTWRLHMPYMKPPAGWDGTLWYEVVVFWNGTMLVHGDIDHVMFGHYGKFEKAEEVVRWMGGTKDVAYYVLQKAAIGMGSARDCLTRIDDDVLFDNILDHIEQNYLDGRKFPALPIADESLSRRAIYEHMGRSVEASLPEWLALALDQAIQGCASHDIIEAVREEGDHDAWESGFFEWGEVPSSRLVAAYAALRRLVALLDLELDVAP